MIEPPVPPMLARLARELPVGPGWSYEPKWDGFRCLAFRRGDSVELQSRNERPFGRYFPEVVDAIRSLPARELVLDGELLVVRDGVFDFPALLARLHPAASRVARLATETPASYVAFDLLSCDGTDLLGAGFAERRARLEQLLPAPRPHLGTTPLTNDERIAAGWLDEFTGGGVDGVVAKRADSPYQPGKRVMVKVKRERTADCVVAGFRLAAGGGSVSSLLLGLHDAAGALVHVGVVQAFAADQRRELLASLRPLVTRLEGHPWERGFGLEGGALGRLSGTAGRWTPDLVRDWVPLRPERVCEVAYDQVEGVRFRHPARFRRWRPDRDPRSCTTAQLATPGPLPVDVPT